MPKAHLDHSRDDRPVQVPPRRDAALALAMSAHMAQPWANTDDSKVTHIS